MRYCLLALLFIACEKVPTPKEELRPVLTETVEISHTLPPLYFSGFSKAERFINLSFRVSGLIQKLPINVGDRLKGGQVIAELDPTDYIIELQNQVASLDEAEAEARKSTAQYKRIKALYESESASRDELDSARAAHEAAKAAVEQANARVDLAEKQLSYTTLYAEYDHCEVSTKEAEINENVTAGEPIAQLTCGTKLEVEVAIPESEISDIYVGQKTDVIFQAFPNRSFSARVTEVGVSAAGGATFPVTVRLDETSDQLRSGMATKVIFYDEKRQEKPTIIVPIEAVGEDRSGYFVYVYEGGAEGVVYQERVTIGELRPGGFTITSGLLEGQKVVIAGLRFLYDGKKVKLLEEFHIKRRER